MIKILKILIKIKWRTWPRHSDRDKHRTRNWFPDSRPNFCPNPIATPQQETCLSVVRRVWKTQMLCYLGEKWMNFGFRRLLETQLPWEVSSESPHCAGPHKIRYWNGQPATPSTHWNKSLLPTLPAIGMNWTNMMFS